VRDHVHGRLGLDFQELGALDLKNIARPVEAFAVRLDAAGTVIPPLVESAAETPPLPEMPSIAVLAFTNMSRDPEQEYLSDGIVEEIITTLSRVRWFRVISRNPSFAYKGKPLDIRQIGRELGVRYVLEGSIRQASGRIRNR